MPDNLHVGLATVQEYELPILLGVAASTLPIAFYGATQIHGATPGLGALTTIGTMCLTIALWKIGGKVVR